MWLQMFLFSQWLLYLLLLPFIVAHLAVVAAGILVADVVLFARRGFMYLVEGDDVAIFRCRYFCSCNGQFSDRCFLVVY